MKVWKLLAAVLLALLPLGVQASDPPQDFFFQKNDRVVFLGDSITAQYQYSTYIELYLTTRFPNAKFVFLNAGIGGDTANGGASRFKSHILDEQPTAVTINFGMNDGGYGKFNPAANRVFVEKTEAMLQMAKAAGVRVALCSPNAVDRRNKTNGAEYVETQKQFYAPLRELAVKHGIPFADQYAITRAATDAMEKDDPKAEKAKPYYDGFHTSPPGGLLMAGAILAELKAPGLVSSAVIQAKGAKVETKQCRVEDVIFSDGSLHFKRTDEALPLPIQKDWLPMLPYMNQLKHLNDYNLTVADLPDGKYEVVVDGKLVGTYESTELAAGVNLGNATSGPIFEQGNAVLTAINSKNQLVAGRFFNVVNFNMNLPAWVGDDLKAQIQERRLAERQKLKEKIEAVQTDVFKLAQPVPRKFEVRPVR